MPTTPASIIADEIRVRGAVPFQRFMELALYHPEYGFYSSGRARVGRDGDFFTSVSVGPLFGKLLALQFAEMHTIVGDEAGFTVVEQGAHGGDFAADVIQALQAPRIRYKIIEPFPSLVSRQRARLGGFDVLWQDDLQSAGPFTGVHFSNELPDSFPVHLVKWDGAAWHERYVKHGADGFTFTDGPLSSVALSAACSQIPRPLVAGYTTEVNLAARAWIAEVAKHLTRGFVLLADYGFERDEFYSPARAEGTLSAYSGHRRVPDPLSSPGEIDLTAHVEFTSLIETAEASGLRLAGFTDQHRFLARLGSVHFADGKNAGDLRAFQTLMHPQFMGGAFKVLCFSKGIEPVALTGFRPMSPPGTTP